jgi:hypothetical protein
MDPDVKKLKKKARKAGTQAKPAIQTQSNPPVKNYNWSWEEEQLVNYDEPEEPAAFSPLEEENYRKETITRPTEMGRKTRMRILMNFPLISRRL